MQLTVKQACGGAVGFSAELPHVRAQVVICCLRFSHRSLLLLLPDRPPGALCRSCAAVHRP